jgi:hypothetical protein
MNQSLKLGFPNVLDRPSIPKSVSNFRLGNPSWTVSHFSLIKAQHEIPSARH